MPIRRRLRSLPSVALVDLLQACASTSLSVCPRGPSAKPSTPDRAARGSSAASAPSRACARQATS
eukprot:3919707-Alexandrium_andersonii.AAC.1